MSVVQWAFALSAVFGVVQSAANRTVWLVVGASNPSPAAIAVRSAALRTLADSPIIVRTDDCGDARRVFAWVATVDANAASAQLSLAELRPHVRDAYLRRCTVKAGSLLALGISAIDSSIASVPSTAVNWRDEDRVSRAVRLADGRSFLVIRYYHPDGEYPLEGRRERVINASEGGVWQELRDGCTRTGRPVLLRGSIAFDCVRGQAGDNLLHTVVVFDRLGHALGEVLECRRPRWRSTESIACQAESVDQTGRLRLSEKRVVLRSGVP